MKKWSSFLFATSILIACTEDLDECRIPACDGAWDAFCSLLVEDATWPEDKSSYLPGVGVGLDGKEIFGLFYDYNDTQKYGVSMSTYSNPVKATPTADKGVYSFSAPAESDGKYWYAIVPYSRNGNRVSGFNVAAKIPNIQFPLANSFDPAADILLSQPFKVSGTDSQSASVRYFKRLTAPLRVDVTGVPEGEKIYAFSVSFSQVPVTSVDKTNYLTGWSTFYTGQSASDVKLRAPYAAGTAENAVSAVYPDGLSALNGSWPVWLSVLPATMAAGGSMTISVLTSDKEYVRTVGLSADMVFLTDKINCMTFDVAGNACMQSDVISQDFINNGLESKTTATKSYLASDGKSYQWGLKNVSNWTAAANDGGSNLSQALSLQHGDNPALTLPDIGKDVKKIRLYLHPLAPAVSGGVTVCVKDGDTEILRYMTVSTLTRNSIYKGAGYIEIECPSQIGSLGGKTLTVADGAASNVYFPVSRIALFTSGSEIKTDCYDFDVEKYNVGLTRKLDTFDALYVTYKTEKQGTGTSISYAPVGSDFIEGNASFKITYSFAGKSSYVRLYRSYASYRPDLSFSPVGISFYVKGKKTNAGKLRFTLIQDKNGKTSATQTYIYDLKADVLKMDKWVKVFIPFSEFQGANNSSKSVPLELNKVFRWRIEILNDKSGASSGNEIFIDCLEQLTSAHAPVNPSARFSSIFIQLNNTYVGTDWEALFSSMKEVGIDTYIIAFALRYRDGVANSFYSNCKIPFIENKYAIMDYMFPAAEKLGVKLIVGTMLQKYESGRYSDKSMYETLLANQKLAVDDIVANFGSSPSFVGWYSPDEFHDGSSSSTSFLSETATNCLAFYEEETCKYMKSKKDVQTLVAPALWRGCGYEVSGDFFYRVFSQTPHLDALYLQDCSGRGPEQLVSPYIDLPNYYAAIKDACERTGVQFGIDLESFMSSDAYGIPHRSKTWDELLPPLVVASQYTDNITNFSYLNFKPGIPSFEQYRIFIK